MWYDSGGNSWGFSLAEGMIYREGTTKGLPLTLALTTVSTIVKRWLTKLSHSHVFPVTRTDSDSLHIQERRGPLKAPDSVCQILCSYSFCSHGHARGCAALHVQTMACRKTKRLTSPKGLREEPESDGSHHVPMGKDSAFAVARTDGGKFDDNSKPDLEAHRKFHSAG